MKEKHFQDLVNLKEKKMKNYIIKSYYLNRT